MSVSRWEIESDAAWIARSWIAVVLACGLMLQPIRSGATPPTAATPSTAASWSTAALVERLTAMDTPVTSFRALRRLTADTRGGQMQARLTAWTSLDPIAGFQYSIVDEEGSGIIRQKVLRAALEAEQRMRATGMYDNGALTPANYEFADGMPMAEGLMRVGIRPKRRDTILIDGCIMLTDPGGDLVRIEGVLSKRPSVWTREVQVVRQYARIGGVRVPIEMRSVARVLIAGRSTFSMTYEYESINGAAVELAPR